VISGIGIEEGESFTANNGVDGLVDPREWKVIL
jgi:hypothetical protein